MSTAELAPLEAPATAPERRAAAACRRQARRTAPASPGHRRPTSDTPFSLLGDPATRPGIAGTAYDTAWLAGVRDEQRSRVARFPTALQWLVEHQHLDGSWGGALRYEHDRLLCTLAALPPLATFGRRAADRAAVERGTRYLWQHGHLLAGEPVELVGFELLLPTLIERARSAGIAVPPHLDIYGRQRADKLRLLPPEALYSPGATVAHSLEFLGEQADSAGLRAVQGENGAIGNSPAATAFFYARTHDARALAYLEGCLARTGGAMAPVLHPCERFETLWAAYHLYLAGVPVRNLLSPAEQAGLQQALAGGGVSLSSTFPIADADDTAVALLLLHELGEPVDVRVLERFLLPAGHFASFPYERHGSVGVNLHVLHTLTRVPGFPQRERVITHLLDYLAAEQGERPYWFDKWHISPYYATAHALCVLADLPADLAERIRPLVQRAREWLRQTQNPDGSWGFYGRSTAEETAYAVLALATAPAAERNARDRRRCAAGVRSLDAAATLALEDAECAYPPLWIDKCLYNPTLIVQSVIMAARTAQRRPAAAVHEWRTQR